MTSKHEVEKGDGKKSKLAGLARLSHDQLVELHDATDAELARRAKEGAKKKPPSQLSDAEFLRLKQKYFEGESDDE